MLPHEKEGKSSSLEASSSAKTPDNQQVGVADVILSHPSDVCYMTRMSRGRVSERVKVEGYANKSVGWGDEDGCGISAVKMG